MITVAPRTHLYRAAVPAYIPRSPFPARIPRLHRCYGAIVMPSGHTTTNGCTAHSLRFGAPTVTSRSQEKRPLFRLQIACSSQPPWPLEKSPCCRLTYLKLLLLLQVPWLVAGLAYGSY